MSRLSMNEVSTYRWSFEEDVSRYVSRGYASIGVWRQKLSDYGEEKGAELLAESGLDVSNLLWCGGFTGSDGRSHRESIDDAADAVRLGAELKAGAVVIYSGGRAGHTHNHARRMFREALKELAELAGEFGVNLAVEPMHPGCAGECTFLTDLDGTLDLLDSVAHPQAMLAFDTYHLGGDATILARIPEIVSRIAIVHLGDGRSPPVAEQDRCRLGDGNVPLKELVGTLSAAGYDGDYDVVILGPEIQPDVYDDLLTHSQRAYAGLLSVAESAS